MKSKKHAIKLAIVVAFFVCLLAVFVTSLLKSGDQGALKKSDAHSLNDSRAEGREHSRPPSSNGEKATLGEAERARVISAAKSFSNFLRKIEFKNSKLKWEKTLPDRKIFLYQLSAPSKTDLNDAELEISGLSIDLKMNENERKAFNDLAHESLKSYFGSGRSDLLFLDIPVDINKDIFCYRTPAPSDLSKIIGKLEASEGRDRSLGESGGEIRSFPRTQPGWRYENFLMVNETE
jgi:hypothetical protein